MSIDQEHYNWIVNIIDSCNNDFHFTCVDKLIELFKQQHSNKEEMAVMLETQRAVHWNNIHAILT